MNIVPQQGVRMLDVMDGPLRVASIGPDGHVWLDLSNATDFALLDWHQIGRWALEFAADNSPVSEVVK